MAKTAVVTGGTRGIGEAISKALKAAGYKVAATYAGNDEAANKFKADTGIPVFKFDVSDYDACAAGIAQIEKEVGPVDILVNNAGITKDGLLMRMSEEDWDAVIDTNLKSAFNFAKAAIRPMMSQRSGKIINITSIAGVIGNAGQANYAASKAGMIGFTKSLAKELGSRNIQVNAIAPGFVETDMTAKLNDEQRKKLEDGIPLKRTAKPEEIAAVVRFFASADANYITGQVLCVDGGLVM